MRQETASWITIGGLVTLSCVVVVVGSQLTGFEASVATLVRHALQGRSHMQMLEEDVKRRDGSSVHVTTTRREGESVADFLARHNEIVEAIKAS